MPTLGPFERITAITCQASACSAHQHVDRLGYVAVSSNDSANPSFDLLSIGLVYADLDFSGPDSTWTASLYLNGSKVTNWDDLPFYLQQFLPGNVSIPMCGTSVVFLHDRRLLFWRRTGVIEIPLPDFDEVRIEKAGEPSVIICRSALVAECYAQQTATTEEVRLVVNEAPDPP